MFDKEKDVKNLSVLQKPLRFEPRPFEQFAKKLGIDESQTIELIKEYISRGVISVSQVLSSMTG